MVLHQMAAATQRQPANLILGEDKIGFIFLDCRGNTPGGEGERGEVRTLELHCNSSGTIHTMNLRLFSVTLFL